MSPVTYELAAAPEAVGAYRLCHTESRRCAGDNHQRKHQRDTGRDAEHFAGCRYAELAEHLPPQRTAERRADRDSQQQRRQQSGGDAADDGFREPEECPGKRECQGEAAGDAEGGRDPGQPDTFGSVMPNLPRSAPPSACASPRDGRLRMRTRYAILSASFTGQISAG